MKTPILVDTDILIDVARGDYRFISQLNLPSYT